MNPAITAATWIIFLTFGSVITQMEETTTTTQTEHNISNTTESTNATGVSESPETIQSLNPWVKIPEDFKSAHVTDDIITSSEEFYSSSAQVHSGSDHTETKSEMEPYFDHAMMTNLSEHLGSHAFLKCRVKNLGDRTVSWIRRRDWHILTSGRTVYTNDDRFQIMHSEGSDEWTLVIRYIQTRDNGTYECQVASGRGIIAHLFNMNVLVPQAFILGAKEYHVQQGTVISLVCIIENSPRQSAQYLYWYHNSQMINYGSGISVHTEPGIHTHSRLTIPLAGPQHAGDYTCKAANTQPDTVHVYVSDGDKTAAIQRQGGSQFVPPNWTLLTALLFLRFLPTHLFHFNICSDSSTTTSRKTCRSSGSCIQENTGSWTRIISSFSISNSFAIIANRIISISHSRRFSAIFDS